jgi:hypothetical protein
VLAAGEGLVGHNRVAVGRGGGMWTQGRPRSSANTVAGLRDATPLALVGARWAPGLGVESGSRSNSNSNWNSSLVEREALLGFV